MLVLSRKPDEKIRIGPDIVISIIAISDGQVRLGIEAPSHLKIYREELYEKLKESNVIASASSKNLPKDISKLKIEDINKKD